jgi:UDP-galactopyranose mutase
MTRLAANRRVFFIEEPISGPGTPHWQHAVDPSGVIILRPVLPGPVHGWNASHSADMLTLLSMFMEKEHVESPIAWLYTPMAISCARALQPVTVVYDCMDELSLFRGAPPELIEREQELLGWADLVFTGGPSLYRAKKNRHPDVHCFPSSVEAEHFRKARPSRPTVLEPAAQRELPGPRLGFFGVLDERLDIGIVDAVARAHPEWQIVMVGPVVKIDPADLPRHPNIHYLGQQSYDALPGFLRGWDVCLLPFARNESTQFISPTKTLEYMAAERPIVSTPIRDVAEPYGDTVFLGDSPESFVAACERALAISPEFREGMVRRMRLVIAGTSWDRTAGRMAGLLDRTLAKKAGPTRAAMASA